MGDKKLNRSASSKELPKSASDSRQAVLHVLKSKHFDNVMGFIICCYFIVVIFETDLGAQDKPTPMWVKASSWIVLIVFLVELILRLYVYQMAFWSDRWAVFDFIIISVDLIGSIVGLVVGQKVGVGALRVLRLSRLARASKVLKAFPELRLMVAGLLGAMHSIFWGTLFLLVALLIWSVIAVQFVHPLNQELTDKGVWKDLDCERCPRAFESVFQSTLTFTQQIVAGDSWGTVTVPIIEAYPATGIFFMAVLLSVGLAILNLILGVVVNVATLESDNLRTELETERRMVTQKHILDILSQMDEDGNEELNKEETFRGYHSNAQFRDLITSLDLEEEDMEIVWGHLDADGDGTIGPKEFAQQLLNMKSSNTQFMLAYIKHYIRDMKKMMMGELKTLGKGVQQELSVLESEFSSPRSPRHDGKVEAGNSDGTAIRERPLVKEPANDFLHSVIEASVAMTRLHDSLHQALNSVVDIQKRSSSLCQNDISELQASTMRQVAVSPRITNPSTKPPTGHPLYKVAANGFSTEREWSRDDPSVSAAQEHNGPLRDQTIVSREDCVSGGLEIVSRTSSGTDRRTLMV